MDSINFTGIRSYGYVGYLPEEQRLGQWFEVDLTIWRDLSKAGQSDRLEDTSNYALIVQMVQYLVKTNKFLLLEKMATAIAEAVLASEEIEQVRVCLTKVAAPIPDFDGRISVELTRTK